MNLRKACYIFQSVTSTNYSLEEKAAAIDIVCKMATHNGITKDSMLGVIRFLLDLLFVTERTSECTKADYVRSMTDAELAAYLLSCDDGNFTVSLCDYCPSYPECNNDCSQAALRYLQSPVEVSKTENS
jgi:hypothetical protein